MHAMVSSTQTQTFQGGEGFSREARPFFFFLIRFFKEAVSSPYSTGLRMSVCVCVCVCRPGVEEFFLISRRVDSNGNMH